LVIGGSIPLLGLLGDPPDTMLLIFTIYVGVWFGRARVTRLVASIPVSPAVISIGLCVVSGWIAESLAWTSSYLAAESEPALLHPQLIPDLILAVMYYGGWGVAWVVLRRRYDYSTKEVFVLQGLYGVLLEQLGAVFLAGLFSMPLGLILWAYVFVVYGSIMGIAYLPIEPQVRRPGTLNGRWKPVISFAVLLVVSLAVMLILGSLFDLLDLLPEKRFIGDHPFW